MKPWECKSQRFYEEGQRENAGIGRCRYFFLKMSPGRRPSNPETGYNRSIRKRIRPVRSRRTENEMFGAILGDIIGSPFEFDRGDKTKDFELFTEGCSFTDDTVLSIAVADALMAVGRDASEEEVRKAVTEKMQSWGKKYPYAGYGGRFRLWLAEEDPKPYFSYGNGSAMRVSPVGWLYDTLERTREVAAWTAEVSHDHPEGIKGAAVTAGSIFLARNGAAKEDIRKLAEQSGYDMNRTLDEIRPSYHHMESCQETVPEAIIAFLEAEDFEDAIRNAVSLGGDTDTQGAITGSIAEAYFGIPEALKAECRNRVDRDMRKILDRFEKYTGNNK